MRTEFVGHGITDANKRGSQVRLAGPEGIRLRSATVQILALALHELATNALKYGALSRPEGRLLVRWDIVGGGEGGEGERCLRVAWVESGLRLDGGGGRPGKAAAPEGLRARAHRASALPYQLKVRTTYDLTPSGVQCTITLPISTTGGPWPSLEKPDGAI